MNVSAEKSSHRLLLPSLLALAVLGLGLWITHVVWVDAKAAEARSLRAEFDFRVRETAEAIQSRMDTYRQVLRGARGLMYGSIQIDRDRFEHYIASSRLEENYPGIQGIAIAEIVPASQLENHIEAVRAEGFPDYTIRPPGPRDIYTSITQIQPFNVMNQRAFGFDMYTEPTRRIAMERARDTGRAALSGRVKLVQESETNVQSGFLMYLPVYRRGVPLESIEQRRAHILGWVYAPFRVNDFMAGLGGARSAELQVSIYDGAVMSPDACLYRCNREGEPASPFRETLVIEMVGHTWTMDVHAAPSFASPDDNSRPQLILVAGLGISLLLAMLVWILATGRSRALNLALGMTRHLRASEFRWKFALEGAGDGVWDWEVPTGRVSFSQQWKSMLGYEDRDIGNHVSEWTNLIHEEDQPSFAAAMEAYLNESNAIYSGEYRLKCKDGSWKWVSSRGMAVSRDENGRPTRIIGTHRNITERKETERRELERQQALDEARNALQKAQRLEAVGKLTGGVAHDFNNVLQIISGNIQLLLHGADEPSKRQLRLQSMLSAVDRGAKLSTQLLAFARRQPLQPQVKNIAKLIANMEEMLTQALGEAIKVETRINPQLWTAYVDPNQLENVLLNLAINARDAMEGSGKLIIEADNETIAESALEKGGEVEAGDYVMLSVSDTGSGIPPDIIEHVFEPFFTTKPEGRGTGLGLSMAYGFVKQSGGHIRIHSEMGRGTTLTILLPRSEAAEHKVSQRKTEAVARGDECILVVEDDAEVQSAVVAMLRDLGYGVLKADNAENGLAIIKDGAKIDLLFTDVVMPGSMRSVDLVREAQLILPGLPVLYTSGYAQDVIVHDGRLDPGVRLLSKPYSREQLAKEVRLAIDGKGKV